MVVPAIGSITITSTISNTSTIAGRESAAWCSGRREVRSPVAVVCCTPVCYSSTGMPCRSMSRTLSYGKAPRIVWNCIKVSGLSLCLTNCKHHHLPFIHRTLHQAGSHGSVQYGCSGGEIVPVHKLREQRTKRSDTARRHVLSRQTKIEKDELAHGGSPKQTTHQHQQQQPAAAATISRRASTVSNASVGSKQLNRSSRRASTISKTPSVDSRGAPSTLEINSPERSVGLTPRKGGASGGGGVGGSALISTPSVDRECR